MGYGDRKGQTLLMSGHITAVGTSFSEGGSPALEVSGLDAAYRLSLGNSDRQMEKATIADMVSRIAADNGFRARVSGPPGAPRTLVNNFDSDLAYLISLSTQASKDRKFEFYARPSSSGDTLHFGPRDTSAEPIATLTWGVDLLSFTPEVALGKQVSKVVVHASDELTREKIVGTATREASGSDGKSGGDTVKEVTGKEVVHHVREPMKSQEEADERAAALLAEMAQSYVGGSGETFGLPELLPDTWIELAGLGKPFAKTFYVSGAVHEFGATGYRTRFTVERTAL
jgi:phage protein D